MNTSTLEDGETKLAELKEIHRLSSTSGFVTVISFLTLFYSARFTGNMEVIWALCGSFVYSTLAGIVYNWSAGMMKRVKKKGLAGLHSVTYHRLEQMRFFARILNATYLINAAFVVIIILTAYWV